MVQTVGIEDVTPKYLAVECRDADGREVKLHWNAVPLGCRDSKPPLRRWAWERGLLCSNHCLHVRRECAVVVGGRRLCHGSERPFGRFIGTQVNNVG